VEPLTLQLSRKCQAPERSASAAQVPPESLQNGCSNEVTLEALINLGITDTAEQISILGYDPRARAPPQPPAPADRRDEVTVEQLIAIGVTDAEEQARILGSAMAAGASDRPVSNPQQPPPSPAAPVAAPQVPASDGTSPKEKGKSQKMKVLGRAEVDMTKPFGCGSFKNAYIGVFEGTKIVILAHRAGGTAGNADLLQEIDILQRLPHHPHITKYLGNFVYGDGGICLAMELCRFGGLDEWLIRHKGKITEIQRSSINRQVCASMIAVAAKGIIHRDLAAHNVLVSGEDPLLVKLTDFGRSIVKTKPLPESKKEILAIRWAAPEILQAAASWTAPWTEKSDVWAFGVTCWQVYAGGEVPYTLFMADQAITQRVIGGGTPPQPNGCPASVFAVLQRCWAFQAEGRPTFAELEPALAAASNQK